MKLKFFTMCFLFVSFAYAQPKDVDFEFTNRTDMELSYVCFFSKWDNSKGRNYIAGSTLKPGEKIIPLTKNPLTLKVAGLDSAF
ncbi:MAG: hypothetical protein DWP94_02935 [Flavobacterium sp.]|nr:MAG: hypothetical protein DWP94_02935 [Flavobacterium sp.]